MIKLIQDNLWSILIGVISVIVMFVTVQTKVTANEVRINTLENKIEALISINQTILIKQAEMQKDIEFIKDKVR